LAKDGYIPIDEIEKQLDICRTAVRNIRERHALEKENHKHTLKIEWVRNFTADQHKN
jgi:hypothetical protein